MYVVCCEDLVSHREAEINHTFEMSHRGGRPRRSYNEKALEHRSVHMHPNDPIHTKDHSFKPKFIHKTANHHHQSYMLISTQPFNVFIDNKWKMFYVCICDSQCSLCRCRLAKCWSDKMNSQYANRLDCVLMWTWCNTAQSNEIYPVHRYTNSQLTRHQQLFCCTLSIV